jgi:hypothetical protein
MAAGSRLTLRQSLEGDLEQGRGTFGDAVHAPDDPVERLLVLGKFAAPGLLTGWRKPGPAFS